ncbi:pleiotropic regulatory protein RsmS [Shewanella sp. UCD-KL12]|uniref:pleiotropic regulatory protein RsmS n=1 Tax=Shewanella sp. UCD-KL12 TaxID=1917163 RepID=UPI00097038F7|nr:pleiotropic regulatory protein RsmS [Shewanella sp. UCD-KL12]
MSSDPSKDKVDIEVETLNKAPSPIDDASDDIKLAVDLIYLFENNKIDPKVALSALEIVKSDLQRKLKG